MITRRTAHKFTSFDGGTRATGELWTADTTSELATASNYREGNVLKTVIARGAGMSFAAASFASDTASIDMTGFNRIEVFEPGSETITVQPGISVGVLLDYLVQNGFHLPVLPGYPTITVGGCIAADVHGKNQMRDGTFLNQIVRMKLHHVDHGELELSRDSNPEIFDLTVGGFGLTGTILSVTLKVSKLPSRYVESVVEPVSDIYSLPENLAALAETSDFVTSWHDFNRSGGDFGRGFIQSGRFRSTANDVRSTPVDVRLPISRSVGNVNRPAANDVPSESAGQVSFETDRRSGDVGTQLVMPIRMEERVRTPFTLTSSNRGAGWFPLLGSQFIAGAMNSIYDSVQRMQSGPASVLSVEQFCFPNLLLRNLYFHAFGKNGLFEHQCVIPVERFDDYADRVKWWLSRTDLPVTMASAKLFAGEKRLLRFSADGICFALDFPRCPDALRFLTFLDALVLELGALPNIFKDSRLGLSVVDATYPQYENFVSQLRNYDPARRYRSELSQRLKI